MNKGSNEFTAHHYMVHQILAMFPTVQTELCDPVILRDYAQALSCVRVIENRGRFKQA